MRQGVLLRAPVALAGSGEVAPGEVQPRPGTRIEFAIDDLNPILRDWGTAPAPERPPTSSTQIDRYVVWRLNRLLIKKRGRNLHAGMADQRAEGWFTQRGLYRLRGAVRDPKTA